MASSHNIPVLSYDETVAAVIASLEDGQVPAIEGAPGIGKTALLNAVATALGLEPVQLVAREYEPHELSGVMDVRDGRLTRHLIGPARKAIERPCLVLVDEVTAAPGPVFANMAKVLHERKFGDELVHPQTLFICAFNPQAQSLDANDMPLPLINRLRIFKMRPTVKEVQAYFTRIGEAGSALRMVGEEFANVLDAQPGLLDIEPPHPDQCAQQNINWASPRSWERAVRTLAREQVLPAKVLKACLAGDLGPDKADAFLAIRATYGKLPSISEIIQDPKKAKLPKDFIQGVGVLSLLGAICQQDPCAAWVYCARVDESTFGGGAETRIALASALGRVAGASPEQIAASPHAADFRKARVELGVSTVKARGKV